MKAFMQSLEAYNREIDRTRDARMQWWREARFGMFVHWTPFAIPERAAALEMECLPMEQFEKMAYNWKPKPGAAREWVRAAKRAGMKYAVLTVKHGDGFCLWDTQATDFNSVQHGPRRDLVQEFVDACREFGLRIGFYFCMVDLHWPDSQKDCVRDPAACRRYVAFVRQCACELMSRYGVIDILWWDGGWIFRQGRRRTQAIHEMVRSLQPEIVINDRAMLPEDFWTPESRVEAGPAGRDWEACMTFNGIAWSYMPSADIDAVRPRDILAMLNKAAAYQGNLLLNVGPAPDGSLPPAYHKTLQQVGRWLSRHGEAVYGQLDRVPPIKATCTSLFSVKGNVLYAWVRCWPGRELPLGGFITRLRRASFLATGKPIAFEQKGPRIVLQGLPASSPDRTTGVTVLKLEFASRPENLYDDAWEKRTVRWDQVMREKRATRAGKRLAKAAR